MTPTSIPLMPPSQNRITIKHVASRAGVSFSAVSKILREDPTASFNEATRRRVLTAARELGYAPDPFAQTLRSGKTRLVGILLSGIRGVPVRQRKLDAAIAQIVSAGYQPVVENSEHRRESHTALLHDLMRMRSCALLVAFGNVPSGVTELGTSDAHEELAELGRAGIPLVGMEAAVPGDWVAVDRRVGAFRATNHLVNLGHRRIAFLGMTPTVTHSPQRLLGFRQALEESSVAIDPDLIVSVPGSLGGGRAVYEWGDEAATELLTRRPDVTGLVTLNDRVAMGAVRAALRMGRRIPENLSVIGFDGDPEAEYAAVAITTLEQPVAEMAERVAQLLLADLSSATEGGRRDGPQHLWLEPRLVERESCGPPPD